MAEPLPERLRIYLLGGLAMSGANGAVVDERAFPGRQGRRLFVRLVTLHEPASAEQLADDIWPDALPDAWHVALRSLISKLRGLFAVVGVDEAIGATGGSYSLHLPADAWIDVEAADALIHRAEPALAADDLAGAAGWALAARAIASRPLLPSEETEWIDRLRHRLDDVRVRALECLGETWIAHGDARLAVRDATEAITFDPYRESAHRLLIRAHIAAGEHAAALRAYEALERTLREDLGVDPSLQTNALVRSIKTE